LILYNKDFFLSSVFFNFFIYFLSFFKVCEKHQKRLFLSLFNVDFTQYYAA
jgi:hypothetical protein